MGRVPGRRAAGGSLNAGAVDAGIIGDAPLLFALANGAPVKAIAVDKSNPAGTAVLVSPGSTLKSGADLKGKRIATGKGSIGHFVALKALEQAGISPKEVQWVFLGPVDAKVALLNGSVDAWATWEPYTTQMVKTNEGQILVSGKGLLSGNTFLAATDSALNDPQKRAALQDYLQRLAGAERWAYANLDSYGKTLGDHPLPGGDRPRAVCQPPVAVAAAGRGNSGPTAGNGGLLSRQRPDPHPAGREADL